MNYIKEIKNYIPINQQEEQDKKVLMDYIKTFPHNILIRDNEFAHITSSGFIVNQSIDKALMIHHNIMDTWAWTGGHMDGEKDMLHVAVKEAQEEAGLSDVTPLSDKIASIDILTVEGHIKNGSYISSHVHLSIAYLLVADEKATLSIKEDENSDVRWFDLKDINLETFSKHDVYLYQKLIDKAKL
ncbi:MAG: NUDIX hydrolase [Spirochaetales bacterium]|nr:NUDIX hydrolase [Spirochaetales bacterium]